MTPWREYKKSKTFPKLTKDITADVAIVGGGMCGVLNAYQLSALGLKVVLVEEKELGGYATMDTTAFITEVIDSNLSQISSIFDKYTGSLVWQSGHKAIEEFERIIKKEEISCEFVRCPNFIFASSLKQFKELEEEAKFYKKFRLKGTLRKDGDELNFDNYGYLEVPDQAKFHPSKFLYAIAEKAEALGAKIFENSKVIGIDGTGPVSIKTKDGTVIAKDVIIATYKPLIKEKTRLKKAMYRSYVLEMEIPKNLFKEALYEDKSNPYYYFRVDKKSGDYDRMILGGEDHKDIFGKSLVKQSFESLENFVKKILPDRRYWIVNKWNGPILEPSDGLALIGEIYPHYYVATGFSGNGMTYSMISSMIFKDLILNKRNEWAKVFDPKRTLLHPKRLASKAKDYAEENLRSLLKNIL